MAKIQPNQTIIGIRIKQVRIAKGLTQEAVGVAIGLDESTAGVRISRYETGIHEPDIKTLKKIANVLEVPFVYMYCERDDLADLLKHLVLLDRNQIKKIQKQVIRYF